MKQQFSREDLAEMQVYIKKDGKVRFIKEPVFVDINKKEVSFLKVKGVATGDLVHSHTPVNMSELPIEDENDMFETSVLSDCEFIILDKNKSIVFNNTGVN